MEKRVIQGEDIVLLVDDKTTLHATTHTLKVDLELKELRTKHTNGKEKSPGDISWSVDGDGLVVVDPTITDAHTPEDVLGIVLSKKLVDMVVKSPLSGLTKHYTGKAYITSFWLGTPAGDNATYNYSLTGSGNLTPVTPSPLHHLQNHKSMNEITYNGNALPIHFGIRAINNYVKLQNKEFEETVTTTNSLANLDSIVTLATSGLNEGARKSGSDKRYTEDDVWDMFDDDPTLILKVSEIFIESVAPLTDKLGSLNPNALPTAK